MLNFFKKYVLKWLIYNGLLVACLIGAANGITGAKNVANLLFAIMVLGIVVAMVTIGKATETRDDTIGRHLAVYKFGINLINRGKTWLNIDTGLDTALAIYCAYMGWFWWSGFLFASVGAARTLYVEALDAPRKLAKMGLSIKEVNDGVFETVEEHFDAAG